MTKKHPEQDGDDADASLARLFMSGPELAPPAGLWAALEAKIEQDLAKIDRHDDGIWAETAPGVRTKLLWDGRSLLISCEAGALIPEHEHFAEEHIMVIHGDMIIDGRDFGMGDTLLMPKGSFHGQTTTKTGCLILISYVN